MTGLNKITDALKLKLTEFKSWVGQARYTNTHGVLLLWLYLLLLSFPFVVARNIIYYWEHDLAA